MDEKIAKIISEFRTTHIEYTVDQRMPIEHFHDAYEINFFIRSDVNVFIKDKQYNITDGDFMLIGQYDLHKFIFKQGTYMEIYQIAFKQSFIIEALKGMGIIGLLEWLDGNEMKSININIKNKNEVLSLFRAMRKEYTHPLYQDKPELQARVKANLILMLLYFKRQVQKQPVSNALGKTDILIKQIIAYIDNNYPNPLSLEILASESGISTFRISHLFKEITGFTVVEYIQHRRVVEVEKLLKNTSRSILDICFECGFNNVQHFHRVFKKIHKITPLELRGVIKKSLL